jgi:UDP-N-acetylmuramyl pentapeptide synthase
MKIELQDSRRLTGPNLYWDLPGAVLDVSIEGLSSEQLIAAWSRQVSGLMQAMGWNESNITSRPYVGGVSLVISAPIDVLYAACELNEIALTEVIAQLSGQSLPDRESSIAFLSGLVEAEKNLPLLAMQTAADQHHVPFLWDEDKVSVGFGKTARVWPAREIPDPADIDWQALASIPVGIVTGTNGKSTTVRLAASILRAAGLSVGLTSTDYIRVGDEVLEQGDFSGPGGARTLLRHPRSEAVVLEVARGGLLRRGIGVGHADVAVITNVAADHLGEYGIDSVSDMAEAKFIVRRALCDGAPLVLNADDEESVQFSKRLQQRTIWFGLNPNDGKLLQHMNAGGAAAFLDGDDLVLESGGERRVITDVKSVPVTFDGAARYNISNALAAMAMCHVLGVTDADLKTGLGSFSGDPDANPGRGNLFEKNGIRILLDFAHNEHGVQAVANTVNAFHAKRNIVLMGQAGDREDKDIGALVRAASILHPALLLACNLPGYERGREVDEVAKLISTFALEYSIPSEAVKRFDSPLLGVKYALENARPGDCLVLLALTQRKEVLALIRDFVRAG